MMSWCVCVCVLSMAFMNNEELQKGCRQQETSSALCGISFCDI